MSLYCPQCGEENEEEKHTCWKCGAVLPKDGPDSLVGKTVFDSYVLEEILGQGGMAVVYKGRNKLTDQIVAVKVLSLELAIYSEVKTRFIDEARTLAKLEHPNIVHLINFAEDLGRLCLVMQHADGETLEDILDNRGRVEPRESVRILAAVSDALEHAHKHQVVHRDIKPSNIIIRTDGSVKVTDFGIAKIVRSTKLTQDGQTMGTVRYMSPEQVKGGSIDRRSDIYSLGISLYEAVVGDTPFGGESHFQIMNHHLKTEPMPPRQAGAPISPELEKIILKAIEKKTEDRFSTSAEMAEALRGCPEASGIKGPLSPSKKTEVYGDKKSTVREKSEVVPRKPKKLLLTIALVAGMAVVLGVVLFLVLGPSLSSNLEVKRDSEKDPKSRKARPSNGQRGLSQKEREVKRWLKGKHPKVALLEKKVSWAVKMERKKEPYLRVLSQEPLKTSKIESLYKKSLVLYPRMLQSERISEKVMVRPLVIVFLNKKTFNDENIWKNEGNTDVRYYPLPVATLFLPSGKTKGDSALLYGIASHLCPVRLPGSECLRLAERFEKFSLSR